jgi:cytoskeleton protein RodZ
VVEGSKQVVIIFTDRSWVDVRDSERKFKLFGEIPKGSRKVLGGQPPYKMVIGDAQAVSIRVNGQPFDLAPYAKGNVARFTLDP